MMWNEVIQKGYDKFLKDHQDLEYVVRCKNCKHHQDEIPGMVWCPHVVGSWVNDNDFCSFGERKETEDVGKSDTDDNR